MGSLPDFDPFRVNRVDIFDHDDRIHSLWKGLTCIDEAGLLTDPEDFGETLRGAVGRFRPNRYAIHGRTVKWRGGDVSEDRFCGHPSCGLDHGNGLRPKGDEISHLKNYPFGFRKGYFLQVEVPFHKMINSASSPSSRPSASIPILRRPSAWARWAMAPDFPKRGKAKRVPSFSVKETLT